jgi:hypothetical protein
MKEIEINLITAKEFYEKGYLQEVNRRFFHPLGLSMAVEITDKGDIEYLGILDYRDVDAPLSMLAEFRSEEDYNDALMKKDIIDLEFIERADMRIDTFGSIVEPLIQEEINERND